MIRASFKWLLGLICMGSTALVAQEKGKPNIVFILADDLGYGDVGFNGQDKFTTPHIDQLAREGMQFTQFYAGTTVCAPSRSALLTGQHTGHTYVRGNIGVKPEGQLPLADTVQTFAMLLQRAGYRTAAFGKWGLGPVNSTGDPNKKGFDTFFGYNCQTQAHRYYPSHLWHNKYKIPLTANGEREHKEQYAPDLIQKQALAFLDDVQQTGQPFFLFLPYILPHAELVVPDDSLWAKYKGKFPETPFHGADYKKGARIGGYSSQDYPHAAFAAMVNRLDDYVGQIMAKLKTLGLDNNTLVVFTSDNGPHQEGGADPAFFHSNGGLRGIKRDVYEGGIRVPFVARWPGKIKAGTVNPFIGAFWDMAPTFLEIAGVSDLRLSSDGLSILPTLLGKKQKQHDYLYWEFHEGGGKIAIRKDNWKAVILNVDQGLKQNHMELYRLDTDRAESKNLAAQYPEKCKELFQLAVQAHQPSHLFPFNYE